jgi:hypothetical protein
MVHFLLTIKETILPTVYAESIINDPLGGPATDASAVTEFINGLQTIVLSTAGIIAVAMIIYGAIVLGTAGGNEEKIGKGKKILTYAIGGLIFILISGFLIGTFIKLIGGGIQ